MKPPRPQNAIAHNAFMRWDAVDALRGLAMVWMTVFHFCFDLNHFGYIRQNFYDDPVWTWQRTCILSLFLFTASFGPGHCRRPGPKLAKILAALGAGGRLCAAGNGRLLVDVPQKFYLFWHPARHGRVDHFGTALGGLGALAQPVVATGCLGNCFQICSCLCNICLRKCRFGFNSQQPSLELVGAEHR